MDKDMLQSFYERYASEIYLYLYSMCKNRDTAEDLMQEVFLKALLSFPDAGYNLRAWLYKVARNTCINEYRRQSHEISGYEKEEQIEDPEDTPPEAFLRNERKRLLYESLLTLPDRQKEILELFYFSEMSVKEISEVTGLSPGNIRVLAHRAKKQLRTYLEEKEYDL